MKILFLTNLADQMPAGLYDISQLNELMNCAAIGLGYPLSLLKELAKYAEVKMYNPSSLYLTTLGTKNEEYEKEFGVQFQDFKMAVPETIDVKKLINEVYHPDVLIENVEAMFPFLTNFDKADCFRVMWWSNSPQNLTLPDVYPHIREADLVIKNVDKPNNTAFGKSLKETGVKIAWLPLSINGNRFKHLGVDKNFDVMIIGNVNPSVYPLRLAMTKFLLGEKKYKLFCKRAYGEEYVKIINTAKIFLTCGGVWHFPVMKCFEAMACRCLLMIDDPIDAEELGFKAGENYISLKDVWTPKVENPKLPINPEEWEFHERELMKLLDYYTTHMKERERIVLRGEELIRERHTDEIRAKELYEILKVNL